MGSRSDQALLPLRTEEGALTNCSRVVRHGLASIGITAVSRTHRNSRPCHELARSGTETTGCTILPGANGVAEVGGSNPLAPTNIQGVSGGAAHALNVVVGLPDG